MSKCLEDPSSLSVRVPWMPYECQSVLRVPKWDIISNLFVRINNGIRVVLEGWSWLNLSIFSDIKSISFWVYNIARGPEVLKLAIVNFANNNDPLISCVLKYVEIKT